MDDIKWDVGPLGKLHVRFGKGHRDRGPKQRMVPLINGAQPLLTWFVADIRGQFDDAWDRPGAPLFPSERHNTDHSSTRIGDDALRDGLAEAVGCHLPGWGTGSPRMCCATTVSRACTRTGWTSSPSRNCSAMSGSRPPWARTRAPHPHRGRLGQGSSARRDPAWRECPMIWNLRLAAANRGIWKASELQRMLAERGLVISAGKMSYLWSGKPVSIRLDDLDVICAVLDCEPRELLVPSPTRSQPASSRRRSAKRSLGSAASFPSGVGLARFRPSELLGAAYLPAVRQPAGAVGPRPAMLAVHLPGAVTTALQDLRVSRVLHRRLLPNLPSPHPRCPLLRHVLVVGAVRGPVVQRLQQLQLPLFVWRVRQLRRQVPIHGDYCRLCRCQARLDPP